VKIDRYVWEDRAEHLLALIHRAQGEDDVAEKLHKRWIGFGCLGVVLTIAGVIAAINLGVWLAVVPVVALVFCIVAFKKASGHGAHDLDDRKLASARRLISVLRADVPAGWPLGLEVDFRTYKDGGTVLEQQGSRFGAKAAKYSHEWLILRANLADGSSVVATLADKVSRKEKPKRKRTKVAETFATRASVTVRLGKRHGSAEAVAQRLTGTAPGGASSVLSLQGRGRVVHAVVAAPVAHRITNRGTSENNMDQLATGDTLLQTLHWLYGGVAASRAA
jgi:hypothetical protein